MLRKSVFLVSLCLLCLTLDAFVFPQAEDPMQKAKALLQSLSPEERVGQLFVVTYTGRDLSSGSDIGKLVKEDHIGGVLIKRENGNWKSGDGEAQSIALLTNSLQQLMEKAAAESITNGNLDSPHYIPLLIALSQGGDGYPYDEILDEAPALPSQMAIGASWNPTLSEQTGELVGREFEALGINVLIGPSLDVLERPAPGTSGDLGVQSFGGDPYWVGRMGAAYIKGVHAGSYKKVAVIATHFPGIGASDRNPDQEIATVLKSMGELQQIDLSPFSTVSYAAPDADAMTDGLLVSHIRYQGLQGNIRASTHPISLDPVALNQLLQSTSFATWRTGGGITMSDSLGAKSVRDFYDPTGSTFSGRYIALNAFQAGNDLLQLSDFTAPDKPSQFDTITDTIQYFQQQYKSDPNFAASVDAAVQRILALKYRLYSDFRPGNFSVSNPDADNLKKDDRAVASNICRSGATLLSPIAENQSAQVLEPPSRSDHILILTDNRSDPPCPTCAPVPWIDPDALRKIILSLYGPSASNWVNPQSINSFPLQNLSDYLKGDSPKAFNDALDSSTIVIVLFIEPKLSSTTSPLQDILSQRPDIIQKRNWIVFAMGAPYYLDSTEISKLHVYYGMYSKIPACLNTVAHMLFEPSALSGDSPVSINEVGYDLLNILSPDPNQIIPLYLSFTKGYQPAPTATALIPTNAKTSTPFVSMTATSMPQYRQGDSIWFSTGIIVDHNQHPVPDGTVIRFRVEYPDVVPSIPPLEMDGTTQGGIAEVQYTIERKGTIRISAPGDPEPHSIILQMVVGDSSSSVTTITPTFPSTESPAPTLTESKSTAVPASPSAELATPRMGWRVLSGALLLILLSTVAMFFLHRLLRIPISRMRAILVTGLGGLMGYDYVAYGLPGTGSVRDPWLTILGILGTGVGVILGVALSKYGIFLVRLGMRFYRLWRLKVTSEDGQKQ